MSGLDSAAKPITLLTCTANLRQRGEPTLPDFAGGHTVWSRPGGYTSSANGGGAANGGGYQAADELPPPPAPAVPSTRPSPAKAARPPSSGAPSLQSTPVRQQPRGPATGGGYHAIGDDD